jgi:hypothetical protein
MPLGQPPDAPAVCFSPPWFRQIAPRVSPEGCCAPQTGEHFLHDFGLALRARIGIARCTEALGLPAHRHGLAAVQIAVFVAQSRGAFFFAGQWLGRERFDWFGPALV